MAEPTPLFDDQPRRTGPKLGFWLALVAVLVIQGGCKEAEGPTSSTRKEPAANASAQAGFVGGIDPCTLITPSEAETILQGKVSETARADGFGQFAQCQYLTSGERLADIRSLTVQIHPVDFPSLQKSYAEYGEKIEPVSGVGEAAFWVPGHSMLFVQKGKRTAGFAVWREGVDRLSDSRQVAAMGLARLP